MSMEDVSNLLNKESGLKGMCGMADMRSISDAIERGDIHAKLAREVYIHRIRRYLGAFHLQLKGSVDAIVFTGGIGENDADLRAQARPLAIGTWVFSGASLLFAHRGCRCAFPASSNAKNPCAERYCKGR